MKKSYFLKSVLTVLALVASMQVFAKDVVVELTDKMTYIDGEDGNTSTAYYDDVQTNGYSNTGYNKINGNGQLVLAYKTWHRNWITLIQVDVSNVEGTITGVNFSIEGSGSTDNKRLGKIGVGTLDLAWSKELTWDDYSPSENAFVQYGETYTSSSKLKTDFDEQTWDITDAFTDKKVVTLAVFSTSASGIYVKNPKVTISYTPADAKTASYTVYFISTKTGDSFKDPETRTGSVGETLAPTVEDKNGFTSADGSVKYVFDRYDAGAEVTEDGAAELYLYYNESAVETGISNVTTSVKKDHAICNLNGQRVDANYKGVVIKEGKKVLNK